MSLLNTFTLLSNGVTLALSLGFLFIILWHDARKELNQFFAAFLFLVIIWNLGSLVSLAVFVVDHGSPILPFAIGFMEIGFTGSSIAVYALVAILTGIHSKRFRVLAFSALLIVLFYQISLLITGIPVSNINSADEGVFAYRLQLPSTLFYIIFDGLALYLTRRYRRKIQPASLTASLTLFVIAQSLGLLNPELQTVSIATNVGSIATLIMSFAFLQREIITPLAERIQQVEAVHKVSLAISSHIAIDTVLSQIATQATGWLNADAAGIFLGASNTLELATVHNLPPAFLHARLKLGEGIAGTVAKTQTSIFVENYSRDWKQSPDLPLGKETFGSVICVPLIYGTQTIGVLMVISGQQGRLFQQQDVQLLELLGAQAAVAIAHSTLFAEQQELNEEVEAARSQLETVLTSTENPVIAVDRAFRMIFANPAAKKLLPDDSHVWTSPITTTLPASVFPPIFAKALRDLRHNHSFTYEISIGNKVFLCHLGQLGISKIAGWVAVLNDITQLKELDRLKSEMVRMTSHDLKNPLQAAMANLELLTEDLSDTQSEEIQVSLSAVHKQLARMGRIISNILDLERYRDGSRMEICQPGLLVTSVVDELTYLATEKKVELITSIENEDIRFAVDPEQLERALTNLIENAIKFTPSNGKVSVRVKEDSNGIIFEIEDTGIGIPQHLLPFVFDRFWRGGEKGQKGAEHTSGTGLGLSLVKTIVENHHGKIWVTSEVGQGTAFYIQLPQSVNNKNN